MSAATDAAARRIDAAFRALGLRGRLHAVDLATGRDVAVGADEPVVLASVFKVALVTALYRRHEAGDLDVTQQVEVGPRTGGATGVSAMADPARLSLRDLAYLAIAVSDNGAADVLFDAVGDAAVADLLRALDLRATRIPQRCRDMTGALVADTGADGVDDVQARLQADPRLLGTLSVRDPARTNAATPRDCTALLAALWEDRAAPAGVRLPGRRLGRGRQDRHAARRPQRDRRRRAAGRDARRGGRVHHRGHAGDVAPAGRSRDRHRGADRRRRAARPLAQPSPQLVDGDRRGVLGAEVARHHVQREPVEHDVEPHRQPFDVAARAGVVQRGREVGAPARVHRVADLRERVVGRRAEPALEPQLPDGVVPVVRQVVDDVALEARHRILDAGELGRPILRQPRLLAPHRLDEHVVARGEVVEDVAGPHAGALGDRGELHVGDRLLADHLARRLGDPRADGVRTLALGSPRRHAGAMLTASAPGRARHFPRGGRPG
jgi:hypothetical protein